MQSDGLHPNPSIAAKYNRPLLEWFRLWAPGGDSSGTQLLKASFALSRLFRSPLPDQSLGNRRLLLFRGPTLFIRTFARRCLLASTCSCLICRFLLGSAASAFGSPTWLRDDRESNFST